jgi:hypothetical protein
MPRGRKGSASLFRPSPRHATIWVRYSGPKTSENLRGRYVENTHIPWTDDPTAKGWKAAEKIQAAKEREFANALDPAVAVPQVIRSRRTVREWADLYLMDVKVRVSVATFLRYGYHVAHVCDRTGIGVLTPDR